VTRPVFSPPGGPGPTGAGAVGERQRNKREEHGDAARLTTALRSDRAPAHLQLLMSLLTHSARLEQARPEGRRRRATPTECRPCFGSAVSSMMSTASGQPTSRSAVWGERGLDRRGGPGRPGDEAVQLLHILRTEAGGHRLDTLARAGAEQPFEIQGGSPPVRGSSHAPPCAAPGPARAHDLPRLGSRHPRTGIVATALTRTPAFCTVEVSSPEINTK